jgi:hypothetical protein
MSGKDMNSPGKDISTRLHDASIFAQQLGVDFRRQREYSPSRVEGGRAFGAHGNAFGKLPGAAYRIRDKRMSSTVRSKKGDR